MGGPGGNYDVYKLISPMTVVRRQPLTYSPRSTSRHNFGLLPALADMAGNSLAFRQQSFNFRDLADSAHLRVALLFLAGMLVPAAAILIGRTLPMDWIPILAPALTTLIIIVMLILRASTSKRMLFAFLGPGLLLVGLEMIGAIFKTRIYGAVILAIPTYVLMRRDWSDPFEFFMGWVYTHPRLKPASRENLPGIPAPDFRLLALILLIAAVGPVLSGVLTLVVIVTLCIVAIKREGVPFGSLRQYGIAVLTPFLTYGGPEAFAPGVWQPPARFGKRAWTAVKLFVPFFFFLATALGLFFPYLDWAKFQVLRDYFTHGTHFDLNALLTESPEWWVRDVSQRVFTAGQKNYAWCYPAAIAIGTMVPPLILAAVFRSPLRHAFEATRYVEGHTQADGTQVKGLDDDGRVEWQWYIDRMKDSPHDAVGPLGEQVREAEHLFLGVEPHARFPFLLHEKLLAEHAYFVGDSGSGKTSQGLMPLLIQLIRGHRPTQEQTDAKQCGADGQTRCPPIVILDLKGDMALFQTVKAEAEGRNLEFRFFSPEKGKLSHYFNPFQSMISEHRTDIQLCQLLLDSLGLNHGEGYGRGYYSRQSRQLLFETLRNEELLKKLELEKPRSLSDLDKALRMVRAEGGQDFKDTLELLSTVQVLATYENLAFRTDPDQLDQVIHMPTVLERGQVVYFWLPSAVESASVREIAKLALYSLLTACIDRQRDEPRKEKRQAYVVIDEFQRIAGENFKVILEQARSFGLANILANQSLADLKTPDIDLRPTVRTNTRVKRFFSVTDPQEVQTLCDASGEELAFLTTWSQTAAVPKTEFVASAYQGRSDTQTLKPRLSINDILAISDHPLDSIVHVSRGRGYTQFAGLPIPVRCTWPIGRVLYEERDAMLWPKGEGVGLLVSNKLEPFERDRQRLMESSMVARDLMMTVNAMGTVDVAASDSEQTSAGEALPGTAPSRSRRTVPKSKPKGGAS